MYKAHTVTASNVTTAGVLIEFGDIPRVGRVRLVIHEKSGAIRLQDSLGVKTNSYAYIRSDAGGDDSLVFEYASWFCMPKVIAADAATVNVMYTVECGC